MSRASVSTWALHSLLGTCASGRPGDRDARLMDSKPGSLDLLDVPAHLASHGFRTMELCHFHIPDPSDAYLATLRSRIEESGIELWSTLIDDGDINHPTTGDRDRQWSTEWIARAGALGSRCVRVVAGKQPTSRQTISRSAEQLLALAEIAENYGIRVLTENWFDTVSTPDALIELLELTEGRIGLCFDFGNWGGEDKYESLAAIASYATSCHAKCQYNDGIADAVDFRRCVGLTKQVGFEGPYTLVHGEPGKVWETLAECRAMLESDGTLPDEPHSQML